MNQDQMLRPSFNRRLFNKLEKGDSINLVGLKGSGCSRALEEVCEIAQTNGHITTVLIDMNSFKYDFEGFKRAVLEQYSLPVNSEFSPPNLLPISTALSQILGPPKEINSKIFLLLDHFDAVLDLPDQRLPKSFFDDLNSLRHRNGISLCCVTEKPHLQYRVFYTDENGRLINTLSWLDLGHLDLPPLLEDEIYEELNRALHSFPLWEKESPKKYIDFIKGHNKPAWLFKVIKDDFESHPEWLQARHRIKRIGHTFGQRYGGRPSKKPLLYKIQEMFKPILEMVQKIKGKQ